MTQNYWTPDYSLDRHLHQRPDPQTVERMRLQDSKRERVTRALTDAEAPRDMVHSAAVGQPGGST